MKVKVMDFDSFNSESKFKTLDNLSRIKLKFKIPTMFAFYAQDYINNSFKFVMNDLSKIKSNKIVIRSSASDEDSDFSSAAGEYDSVLNIPSDDLDKIDAAINTVINSYSKKRAIVPQDEIIIQEMVQNTSMSGVIFTHDLNTGAPYYVINYDDQSGSTDTVTSGNGEYANRTLYIHRNSSKQLKSKRFIKLIEAVKELEVHLNSQFLDIEFALDKDLIPHLLQVRAITTQSNWLPNIAKRVDEALENVFSLVTQRLKKVDGIYGKTTVLGQMPDWNPVEMIGRAPRSLAASLYQTLITDDAWRIAREMMGYSTPKNQALMIMLAGQPFIDTRLSFHSFLPNNVPKDIAEKLVNHWIERLKEFPELHDKVEFEVAITTYSFDIDDKIHQLIGDVLTDEEKNIFKSAHLEHTIKLIKGNKVGSLSHALKKINFLNDKHNNEDINQKSLLSLPMMIKDCIDLGTVFFSILARHGFIAKTILISLKEKDIITQDEIDKILSNVHTVASELVDDMSALHLGVLSIQDFMMRYGHLRPGTYDIMSHRYDQMKDFMPATNKSQTNLDSEVFEFSKKQLSLINKLLEKNGFGSFGAKDLLDYIYDSTSGREYGKFIFTRSVSNMLELIANCSMKLGLSREEVSHVPINTLLEVSKYNDQNIITKKLKEISSFEEAKHEISIAIRLPQLLVNKAGVYIVPFQVSYPNFITNKKVRATCALLRADINNAKLSGKIIIIEGADPGFDWIFSQNISGLITKYGGANSHMAIRCAEFGIPAAIGCGELLFEQLTKTNQVYLDCATGTINPVH